MTRRLGPTVPDATLADRGSGGASSEGPAPRLALVAEDAVVIARIRAGDHAAYEGVFRSYYLPLCEFAYRYLQTAEAAQDVVQEVLCTLWAQREQLRVTTTLDRYLHGAVRNKALNQLRHVRVEERAAVQIAGDDSGSAPAGADDQDGASAERVELLARAIAALPARRRDVLMLRWQRGLSYAEIAELTGMSVKTVEVQLYRALRALRQLVREPG